MKKLGFGTMRLPIDKRGEVDYNLISNMIEMFIDNGFTYFDTAYGYMNKQAESILKKCLVERYPREQFIIADKLTLSKIGDFQSLNAYFCMQLENLAVKYIDVYLVHGLDLKKYEYAKRMKCFEFVKTLKENGKIKYSGISFHDKAEVLEKILWEQVDINYVQLQVNYLDWHDDLVQAKACMEVAQRFGKRIIVMEPLKGGVLASFDEMDVEIANKLDKNMSPASWGIRFAASQDGVDIVLSGMNSIEQIRDNISYMKQFTPISKQETDLLFELAKDYERKKYIPCTGCQYCVGVCPRKLNIPIFMQIANKIKRTDNKSLISNLKTYYKSYTYSSRSAVDCIGCGKCENECPQKISIRKYINEIRNIFEENGG